MCGNFIIPPPGLTRKYFFKREIIQNGNTNFLAYYSRFPEPLIAATIVVVLLCGFVVSPFFVSQGGESFK